MNYNLPAGALLHLAPLPKDMTEDQLSDFLYQHGMDVPPNYCSVKVGEKYSSAMISIPTETTGDLLRWALDHAATDGQEIVVEISKTRRSHRSADGRVANSNVLPR
jgi:hypothetical protein